MLFKLTVPQRPPRRQSLGLNEGNNMTSGYYPNYPPSHGLHEGGAGSNPPHTGFVYGQQQQPSMQQYGSHQFQGAASYLPPMFLGQGQYEGPPGSHITQTGQGPGFAFGMLLSILSIVFLF